LGRRLSVKQGENTLYICRTDFLGPLYLEASGGPELSFELLADIVTDLTSAWFIDPGKILHYRTEKVGSHCHRQGFSNGVHRGVPRGLEELNDYMISNFQIKVYTHAYI
jgi:hypothetical protein